MKDKSVGPGNSRCELANRNRSPPPAWQPCKTESSNSPGFCRKEGSHGIVAKTGHRYSTRNFHRQNTEPSKAQSRPGKGGMTKNDLHFSSDSNTVSLQFNRHRPGWVPPVMWNSWGLLMRVSLHSPLCVHSPRLCPALFLERLRRGWHHQASRPLGLKLDLAKGKHWQAIGGRRRERDQDMYPPLSHAHAVSAAVLLLCGHSSCQAAPLPWQRLSPGSRTIPTHAAAGSTVMTSQRELWARGCFTSPSWFPTSAQNFVNKFLY